MICGIYVKKCNEVHGQNWKGRWKNLQKQRERGDFEWPKRVTGRSVNNIYTATRMSTFFTRQIMMMMRMCSCEKLHALFAAETVSVSSSQEEDKEKKRSRR